MKRICLAVLPFFLLFIPACGTHEHLHHDHTPDEPGHEHKHEHKHEHEHEHEHRHDWNDEVAVNFADFRMTVLGDSVAAGFLSDTQMGAELPADNAFFAAMLSGKPQHPSAFDEHYKSHKNAFTSGKHCVSLACHIEHNNFHVHNLAVSGARLSGERDVDIAAQLTRADTSTTHYVIEAGTNDFCDLGFNKDKLLTTLSDLTNQIHTRNPDAQILIVPVLPVVNLFRNVASSSDTAFTKDGKTYTCGQIRDGGMLPPEQQKIGSFCPRLHGVTEAEQFDALQAELDAVNAGISAMAMFSGKVMHASPPAEDGSVEDTLAKLGEDRITVATSLATQVFDKQHLAADCFHPSQAGLELVANKIFAHVQDKWKPHRVVVTEQPHEPEPKPSDIVPLAD